METSLLLFSFLNIFQWQPYCRLSLKRNKIRKENMVQVTSLSSGIG